MESHKLANFLAAVLLIGTATLCAAQSLRIYRYTDDKGQTAFNSYIPAEFVKNGYAILNERGRVLEEFPPILSREALAVETADHTYDADNSDAGPANRNRSSHQTGQCI